MFDEESDPFIQQGRAEQSDTSNADLADEPCSRKWSLTLMVSLAANVLAIALFILLGGTLLSLSALNSNEWIVSSKHHDRIADPYCRLMSV